ncbi:11936_t:CDS:2, partial [Acaulospora morrowiae]
MIAIVGDYYTSFEDLNGDGNFVYSRSSSEEDTSSDEESLSHQPYICIDSDEERSRSPSTLPLYYNSG